MSLAFLCVLWLYVIVLGVSVGAGLYESRIVIPGWRVTPPTLWQNTGTAFWAYVTTGPLTLLVLAGLAVCVPATFATQQWFLGSLLLSVAERISTFGYFIPTMVRLQRASGLPPGAIADCLDRWARFNYVRHALSIVAWLLALRAMTLSGGG